MDEVDYALLAIKVCPLCRRQVLDHTWGELQYHLDEISSFISGFENCGSPLLKVLKSPRKEVDDN